MYTISGNTIMLTKGDSFYLAVSLNNDDGTPYEPAAGDVIKFTAKRCINDSTAVIEKTIPHDTMVLRLLPEDTSGLPIGAYVYDMQITTEAGDVYTFITESKLILTAEVG